MSDESGAHLETRPGFHPVARCRTAGWRRIAFIGICKHAGKTTAFNHFLSRLTAVGETVGLCSVGIDGERTDHLSGIQKPQIWASEGTLVVSAAQALEASSAMFEWLEELPVSSPLGPLMVARVTLAGEVLLAGVRQRAHVAQAIQRLKAWGAEWCLIDGAFDRIAAGVPGLVDTVVLAVGASAARELSIPAVLRAARPFLRRYRVPAADGALEARLQPAVERGQIGWTTADARDGTAGAPAGSALPDDLLHIAGRDAALFGLPRQAAWSEAVDAVYLPGAVTDEIVADLLGHRRPLQLVADHPAQLLLSETAWARFERAGHRLSVLRPLPLAAVAVNPHHVQGGRLDVRALAGAVAEEAGVPVYDACGGDDEDGGVSRCRNGRRD
ncbi:MAG: hypothetical protein K6T78_03830 [Alicyclobacillus sp.]|nr:hypothetical protein [Alicyclobacillus sp.]